MLSLTVMLRYSLMEKNIMQNRFSGAYTFTTTVTTGETNNITAAYSGSAKYNAYETSMTL